MRLRKSSAASVLACMALVVLPASAAQGFLGPFDSEHEPATVTNPGVSVMEEYEHFGLSISPALWCPDGHHFVSLAVVLSDPSGNYEVIGVPTGSTSNGGGECNNWEWKNKLKPAEALFGVVSTGFVSGSSEYDLNATIDYPYLPGEGEEGTTPFLYGVVGPSEDIIAVGAETQTVGGESQDEPRKNHDITECKSKHLDIISGPEGEYCEESEFYATTTFRQGGWPEAEVITVKRAGIYVRESVREQFSRPRTDEPPHFRATYCNARPKARFRCNVSWLHGPYAFAGTVEIGNLNAKGVWKYGLRVVRTDRQTHQHRTFTVRYGHAGYMLGG